MSKVAAVAIAMFLAVSSGPAMRSAFAQTLSEPEAVGDQVAFFFDARQNYTTFITLRSIASTSLTVRVLFYTGNFSAPLVQSVTLAPGTLRVIDVGSLRDSGLPAESGVAIATAVDGTNQSVVSRALAGNFTVADIATGSGWGAAGAARSAEQKGSQVPPTVGTVINGSSIFLPPIAPHAADLAAYYDPNQLAPPAIGGNQLLFLSFKDVAGAVYSASPESTAWTVQARRNDGSVIANTNFNASGVVVSDLETVAGSGVNGATGWIRFTAPTLMSPPTRLIYFSEALGTFGTGYLLPNTLTACCPSS